MRQNHFGSPLVITGYCTLAPLLRVVAIGIALLLCAVLTCFFAFSTANISEWGMNADATLPEAFAWDLVARHEFPWTFHLARAPALFPDLLFAGGLFLLTKLASLTIVAYAVLQFGFAVFSSAYFVSRAFNIAFIDVGWRYWQLASIAILTSAYHWTPVVSVLFPMYHWGPYLVGVISAGTVCVALRRNEVAWYQYALLCGSGALTFVSDELLLAVETVPLAISLILVARMRACRATAKKMLGAHLAGVALGFCAMALLQRAGLTIEDPPTVTFASTRQSVLGLFSAAPRSLVVALTIAAGVVTVFVHGLKLRRVETKTELPPSCNADAVAFGTWFLLTSSFAGLLMLAMLYANPSSTRYATCVWNAALMLASVHVRLLGVIRLWPWVALAVAFALGSKSFAPNKWATQGSECVRAAKRQLPLQAGLAEYWDARPISISLDWTVQVAPVTQDGYLYDWQEDHFWFTHSISAPGEVPRFNFIFLRNMWEDSVTANYGPPTAKFSCENDSLWFYHSGLKPLIGLSKLREIDTARRNFPDPYGVGGS